MTRVEPFGAFVELAPGVEGLAHISTLGGGKPLRHARDAVKPGDRLEVTVTAVDRERRRLSLAPAGESEAIDAESRAVADRAGGSGKLGTLRRPVQQAAVQGLAGGGPLSLTLPRGRGEGTGPDTGVRGPEGVCVCYPFSDPLPRLRGEG